MEISNNALDLVAKAEATVSIQFKEIEKIV